MRQSKEEREDGKNSFSVRRWRVKKDEDEEQKIIKKDRQIDFPKSEKRAMSATFWAAATSNTAPNPQADLLLHLINQNVFRGFWSNKSLLYSLVADFCRDYPSSKQHMAIPQPCEGLIVSIPVSEGIPASLLPTQMQMDVPHSAWINVIPFPRMRDNLIRWHDHFDHWDFLRDMGGYLVDRDMFTRPHTLLKPPPGSRADEYRVDVPDDQNDDPLAEWNGAIVWGEPYRKENWEFTVHFLAKWAWVFEGCEDFVGVTNTWRQERGAPPLRSAGHPIGNPEPYPRIVEETGD